MLVVMDVVIFGLQKTNKFDIEKLALENGLKIEELMF